MRGVGIAKRAGGSDRYAEFGGRGRSAEFGGSGRNARAGAKVAVVANGVMCKQRKVIGADVGNRGNTAEIVRLDRGADRHVMILARVFHGRDRIAEICGSGRYAGA